jgi:hypothetical protein
MQRHRRPVRWGASIAQRRARPPRRAGIGKSALLEYATRRAEGMRVLSGSGIEAESELPFAGLHQLLWPVLERAQ